MAPEDTRKIRDALRQLQYEVASELNGQVQDEPPRSSPSRLAGLGGPAVRRLIADREEALRRRSWPGA